MLNPVQEYAKARSMPIPALVAVLQGKSDMISLGVAHAALKEKTEAEIARKGADASMMAQAPKVIDRDVAMAQGIAGMPSDVDVPMGGIVGQDGQMTDMAAGGGIVAFQAGGRPFDTTRRILEEMGLITKDGQFIRPYQTEREKRLMAELQAQTAPAPSFTQALAGPPINDSAEMAKFARQAQQPPQAPQVKPEDQGQQPPGGLATLPGAQQTRSAPSSYSDLMTQAKAMAAGAMSDAEPTKNARQFMDDYRTLLGQAGFDFNLAKDEIAAVRAEKEALKGSRKEAANLRLIEAGLGILGGESPYAFVNIGKGASPALKGLAEDLKDIQ